MPSIPPPFRGKRSYEFRGGFGERETACICRECVEKFAEAFAAPDLDDA